MDREFLKRAQYGLGLSLENKSQKDIAYWCREFYNHEKKFNLLKLGDADTPYSRHFKKLNLELSDPKKKEGFLEKLLELGRMIFQAIMDRLMGIAKPILPVVAAVSFMGMPAQVDAADPSLSKDTSSMESMASNMFRGALIDSQLHKAGFSSEDIKQFWETVNTRGMTEQETYDMMLREKKETAELTSKAQAISQNVAVQGQGLKEKIHQNVDLHNKIGPIFERNQRAVDDWGKSRINTDKYLEVVEKNKAELKTILGVSGNKEYNQKLEELSSQMGYAVGLLKEKDEVAVVKEDSKAKSIGILVADPSKMDFIEKDLFKFKKAGVNVFAVDFPEPFQDSLLEYLKSERTEQDAAKLGQAYLETSPMVKEINNTFEKVLDNLGGSSSKEKMADYQSPIELNPMIANTTLGSIVKTIEKAYDMGFKILSIGESSKPEDMAGNLSKHSKEFQCAVVFDTSGSNSLSKAQELQKCLSDLSLKPSVLDYREDKNHPIDRIFKNTKKSPEVYTIVY